ncbi:MAG: response regulator transcription factor [Clostridia bacterium]|nr:response regulator transcription factor [Clostridia bacterium]
MKNILIIEDDPSILDIVQFNLEKEGYRVQTATDGEQALLSFANFPFDLVLLDIMIPRLNGLEVLDSIRSRSDVPVLIMSAKTSEEDRLEGLTRMADDYICKPFSVKELMLRVKVHLSRYEKNREGDNLLTWGDYKLDEQLCVASKNGNPLSLTKKEFTLMLLFAKNPGRCYTREEILRGLWGYDHRTSEDRTVDVAIRRLREKIEEDPSEPRYILSRRGMGYIAGTGK